MRDAGKRKTPKHTRCSGLNPGERSSEVHKNRGKSNDHWSAAGKKWFATELDFQSGASSKRMPRLSRLQRRSTPAPHASSASPHGGMSLTDFLSYRHHRGVSSKKLGDTAAGTTERYGEGIRLEGLIACAYTSSPSSLSCLLLFDTRFFPFSSSLHIYPAFSFSIYPILKMENLPTTYDGMSNSPVAVITLPECVIVLVALGDDCPVTMASGRNNVRNRS